MKTEEKRGVNNLGVRGYMITLCMFLLFVLDAAMTSDLLNISVEAIATRNGWDGSWMLAASTVGGWLALVTSYFAGGLMKKTGARRLMGISLLAFSLCVFFLGGVKSLAGYAILTVLINMLNNVQLGICMNTIVASWFPRKKGIVMGWATIGMSFSTIALLPIFTYLNQAMGIVGAYRVMGVLCLAIGILCYVVVRDLPEECGHAPDNDKSLSREELDAEAKRVQACMEESPWTLGKLLRTKQMWQISIMCGIGMMIATGVISQFFPRFISLGGDPAQATAIISVGGLISLPFSYLWGLLDAKIGPKKVTTLLLFLYALGLILLMIVGANFIGCLVAIVIFMAALSGINNMFVSYTASVFGRYDYANANRIMFPIYMGVRACAFSIVGLGVSLLGGYTGAYLLFFGLCVIAILISVFTKADCIGRESVDKA